MLSFSALGTIYQDETQDTTSTNVTRGNRYINLVHRNILNYWNWPFLETTSTASTVASQQAYTFGYNFQKVKSVTVTVGSIIYPVTEVSDWEYWNLLNQWGTSYTSDIPQFYFVKDDTEIQLYPIPSSASNTITVAFTKSVADLSATDYTTGTASITTATSKYVITGSGSTWTSAMVGRYFQFGTDTRWYEIKTFTSTTSVSLVRAYGGSDKSGDTYTIGEMPSIPEDFHDLVWLGAAGRYWTLKKEDQHAAFYIRQLRDGMDKMKQRYGYKTTGQYIKGYQRFGVIDPNLYPTNLTE